MTRKIELKLTKEQTADFIDWLANDTYWGHTDTSFDLDHGREAVEFVINGHSLSSFSNQHHHVVIDDAYCRADNFGCYIANGKEMSPLDFCLHKLGFSE